jgi:hypothetical protein
MITFKQLGSYGRLGNQLFQVAILKAIQIKNGYEIVLPDNLIHRVWHGQRCNLLDIFELPSCNIGKPDCHFSYKEQGDKYFDKEIFGMPDSVDYFGFFQNVNYYKGIEKELRAEFKMKPHIEDKVDKLLSKFSDRIAVSLHVRRGDMTDGTNPRDAAWANDVSKGSIFSSYYDRAIDLLPSNSVIFLFTGGSRKGDIYSDDLDWCKKYFKDERIIFLNTLSDVETFCFMKKCNINIMSFASTFGWWSSYLNENENVIAPKNFYPVANYNPNNIYPENWRLV